MGLTMQTLVSKSLRIGGAGLALGMTLLAAGCGKSGGANATVSANDMAEGSPNAKITVVEYASVACPICALTNQQIMPAFKAKYVDTGKVRYVYRPMMTGNAAVATAGHLLAQCAGKDKFFHVVDAIMRSQEKMGGEQTGYANAKPVLTDIAQSAGLSEQQFDACVNDPKGIEALNDMNNKARDAGVDATPTFFVNGKRMEQPRDISDFDKTLQPLLK